MPVRAGFSSCDSCGKMLTHFLAVQMCFCSETCQCPPAAPPAGSHYMCRFGHICTFELNDIGIAALVSLRWPGITPPPTTHLRICICGALSHGNPLGWLPSGPFALRGLDTVAAGSAAARSRGPKRTTGWVGTDGNSLAESCTPPAARVCCVAACADEGAVTIRRPWA